MLRIAVGCDHGGLDAKDFLVKDLKEKGFEVIDVGTFSHDSCQSFFASFRIFSFA